MQRFKGGDPRSLPGSLACAPERKVSDDIVASVSSLLCLAGDDLALGGTLDPKSLAFEFLGHLSGRFLDLVDDFVLLK